MRQHPGFELERNMHHDVYVVTMTPEFFDRLTPHNFLGRYSRPEMLAYPLLDAIGVEPFLWAGYAAVMQLAMEG